MAAQPAAGEGAHCTVLELAQNTALLVSITSHRGGSKLSEAPSNKCHSSFKV